jgi:phage N-6-adenine-methyltransferase
MGSPNAGLFTSVTDEWPTPRELFACLDREFRFTLDVCATRENAKCSRYFTQEQNGLWQVWDGVAFMNPPFGRQLPLWVAKAREAALLGATVVCLIPCRTDTSWWHRHVMRAAEIRLIRGRLSFASSIQEERRRATGAHNAPFPSAVVVFRPDAPAAPVLRAIDRDGTPVDG